MKKIKTILAVICYRAKCRLPLYLAALVLISYTGVVSLIAGSCTRLKTEKEMEVKYGEKLTALQTELQAEKEKTKAKEQSEENAEDSERAAKAEMLAKVLYGFRNNNEVDIITACWCVFNRVDIKTGEYAFLMTMEEVINQPEQWMGYSEDNPVIENLYRIADEQLGIWLNGGHRPVSTEYVFLVWSPEKVYLKTSLEDNKNTRTWRYSG